MDKGVSVSCEHTRVKSLLILIQQAHGRNETIHPSNKELLKVGNEQNVNTDDTRTHTNGHTHVTDAHMNQIQTSCFYENYKKMLH